MSKEQEMVNDIYRYFDKIALKDESSSNVSGKTGKCDIALCVNGDKYYLEAKYYNKYNRANYSKQLIAECLYNRKFHGSEAGKFGILVDYFDKNESEILKVIKTYITKEDWEKLGKEFKLEMIFLYDLKNHKLYYISWTELYNKYAPQVITNGQNDSGGDIAPTNTTLVKK